MTDDNEIEQLRADVAQLQAERESLIRRLELRAIENRMLIVALDGIGLAAHAQGRNIVIVTLAIADVDLRLNCDSMLVGAAGMDEEKLGRMIVDALAPEIQALRSERAIHPAAENLLEVMLDLDEVGNLEDTYNVDPESNHLDVREDSIPPFEAALYQWRAHKRAITVSDLPDEPPPPQTKADPPEIGPAVPRFQTFRGGKDGT